MFGNFGLMGLNFGNMNLTSEAIEKKLKDSNTTLDDLLKEEELLQEFRSQNEKLINFFDKDKVKQLLDYIIKEQEDEKDKGYRFPFICSQIFGLEIEKIMKYFFMTNKQIEEEKEREREKQKEKERDLDDSDDTDSEKEEELKNNTDDKKPEQKEENKEKENEDKKEDAPSDKKVEENKEKTEEKKDEQKEQKDDEKKEDQKTEDKNKEEPKKDGENEVKDEKNKEKGPKEEPKKENEENKNTENKENEKKEEGQEKKEGDEEKKEDEEEKDENEEEEKPENKIELLDYFFTFLPEDSEQKLNYVLSGYFSSLIVNLLSLNPRVFLKYVYQKRKDVLDKLVNHCYRKSISDTLSKLLNFENYFLNDPLDDETKEDMNSTRNMLFVDIFAKIDINMDNEDLASIYYLITGLFDPMNIMEEKHIFKEIIENKRIMRSLITKPFHDLDLISSTDDNFEKVGNRRKNFSVIIDIILFFLTNIQKLKLEIPTSISDSKSTITHTILSEEIFNNLRFLIKNNFNKKNNDEKSVLQSFNEYKLKPLGEYKIKIIDLLTHLVPYYEKISKFYDEILIDSEFFKNAFEYLYEYELNNIYQNSLLSLLKALLNDGDFHLLVQDHLFNDLKIVEIIKTHTNLEEKFKFSNEISTPITHGYYSFFISLSYKINTVLGGTPIIIKNELKRQGSFSFIAKVPEEGDKKAAMDLLYGGFDDNENENNEKDKDNKEKENHCESMKKYITDEWRDYFGLNIEAVIKQYENSFYPEILETKKSVDLPFERAKEDENNNIENNEDNEMSKRDKNIFGEDDDDINDDKNEDRGRRGVRDEPPQGDDFFNDNTNNKDNPFKGNDINVDDFVFNDKENNNKNEENPFKDTNIKENDFEFEDNKEENKQTDKKEEKKPEEINKNEGKEEKKEEVKTEEVKDENKKEEKNEDKNVEGEKKEEEKNEEKKEEKKEEKNEDKKEEVVK